MFLWGKMRLKSTAAESKGEGKRQKAKARAKKPRSFPVVTLGWCLGGGQKATESLQLVTIPGEKHTERERDNHPLVKGATKLLHFDLYARLICMDSYPLYTFFVPLYLMSRIRTLLHFERQKNSGEEFEWEDNDVVGGQTNFFLESVAGERMKR